MAAVLELVVGAGPPVVETLLYDVLNEVLGLELIHKAATRQDALLEIPNEVFTQLEAGEIVLTKEHHLDQLDYLVSMFLDGHEAESHELAELSELL